MIHGAGPTYVTAFNHPDSNMITFCIQNHTKSNTGASKEVEAPASGAQCHLVFNTGLGIKDMGDISSLVGTDFISGPKANGWWESSIKLQAVEVVPDEVSSAAPKLPPGLKITMGDDQHFIMEMAAKKLTEQDKSLGISTFHLNTSANIKAFIIEAQAKKATWDIIIIDHHLICEDTVKIVKDTELLKTAFGQFDGCKVVYSANNTAEDELEYINVWASGCIGKGTVSFYSELAILFHDFQRKKRLLSRR